MGQIHSECRRMHRFVWKFQKFSCGDTPLPPLGQSPCVYLVLRSSKVSGFVGPPPFQKWLDPPLLRHNVTLEWSWQIQYITTPITTKCNFELYRLKYYKMQLGHKLYKTNTIKRTSYIKQILWSATWVDEKCHMWLQGTVLQNATG